MHPQVIYGYPIFRLGGNPAMPMDFQYGQPPMTLESLKAHGLRRRVGPRLRCSRRCLAGARGPNWGRNM